MHAASGMRFSAALKPSTAEALSLPLIRSPSQWPCISRSFTSGGRTRGLEISEEKTKITNIAEGFDFLGQNVRKYQGKLLIKPANKSVKALLDKVREIVKKNKSATQANLVLQLNRSFAVGQGDVANPASFGTPGLPGQSATMPAISQRCRQQRAGAHQAPDRAAGLGERFTIGIGRIFIMHIEG